MGNVPDLLQAPATVLPAEGWVTFQLLGTGAGDDSPSGVLWNVAHVPSPAAGLLRKWTLVLAAALERLLGLVFLRFGSCLYFCTGFGTCIWLLRMCRH